MAELGGQFGFVEVADPFGIVFGVAAVECLHGFGECGVAAAGVAESCQGSGFHDVEVGAQGRGGGGLGADLGGACEVGGFLEDVLLSVAANFEAEVKLRSKIKSAMTYPVVVFCIAILAVIGMLLFVVPVFAAMFASLGGQLPLPTRILVMLSQAVKIGAAPVVVILVAFTFWWRKHKNDEKVRNFLDPLKLAMAGVHGAERRGADGSLHLLDTHPFDPVEEAACTLAAEHPGLLVENKRGSLALHYRQRPELEELCVRTMRAAVDTVPGMTLLRGKMVAEAKPGGATKGHAIEAFLAEAPFAGRTPVFIGDDVTDEAGFSTVQRLGGVGIKVGEGATVATRRLADPLALRRELQAAVAARPAKTA